MNNNSLAFFELLRAGLFPVQGERLKVNGLPLKLSSSVDWETVYKLAEEQSVVGLIAAGIDSLPPAERPPQEFLLQFVGSTLQIEKRNRAMNEFVARLIERLRKDEVCAILVKGQGIAQCYEKPLWRASGDIDLLLSEDNYEKAKKLLIPLASDVETEYKKLKHLGMTMKEGFVVELHGTLHSRLSKRVDSVIDEAQKDVFFAGNVRSEEFKSTSGSRLASPTIDATQQSSSELGSALAAPTVQVFLPSPNNDVIFVFTHILHHFFIEGIGLRQICDWCRLLYTYKDSLNHGLLESRIRKAGLMSEWKAFAALAVNWLGMPAEAMPLYSADKKWSKKAERIMAFVLECGNFGHNRQTASGKMASAWYKLRDFARHSLVFPIDSIKFFWHFLWDGIDLSVTNDK